MRFFSSVLLKKNRLNVLFLILTVVAVIISVPETKQLGMLHNIVGYIFCTKSDLTLKPYMLSKMSMIRNDLFYI